MALRRSCQHFLRNIEHLGLSGERTLKERMVNLQEAVQQNGNRICGLRFFRLSFLARQLLRSRARIQQHVHNAYARHAVGQAVMNAEDDGATISLESAHQGEVPKRMSSVQMRANHSGHLPLEIGVCPVSEHDLTYVVTNVEVRVRLPCGQANVEGRKHGALLVTRDEMK